MLVSDASETRIIGTNLTFPRSSSGSYLSATRHSAGTVEKRKRQSDMRAIDHLRQLRHPVPPPSYGNTSAPHPPPSPQNVCVAGVFNYVRSNISGIVKARDGLLEPIRFPPLSSVLGEMKFVGYPPPSLCVGLRSPRQRLPGPQGY